jgi:signal transduction histidine kinase
VRLRGLQFVHTIHGQITVTVLASMIIVIVAGARLEHWVQQDYKVTDLETVSNQLSAIASALTLATPSERDTIIRTFNRGDWKLSLHPIAIGDRFTGSSPEEPILESAADLLFPPDDLAVPYKGWRTFLDGKRVVSTKVGDSDLLILEHLPPGFLRGDALGFGSNYLVALVTLIVILSVFAIWTITGPLRRMAATARDADISSGPVLFPEKGSTEIIALARALNAMQRRISDMLEARTRMLRGISHDLRTPLTRLRLRAERVGDVKIRDDLLADIGSVDRLLNESLSYLRDSHRSEKAERVDLASVAKTICDEFADTGCPIGYQGPERLIAEVRPLAITRAITNLCENAAKFGGGVEVSVRTESGTIIVDVADDGPGIPPEHRDRVMEAFYKVDAARGGAESGFGLGLSIVAEIVQAHQGRLELLDRSPKGLVARIVLPLHGK